MGWNTSLIIIENKENYSNENELLKSLGFNDFKQKENTTFDKILNPKENQIGIGYYNGNLIICDGYLLTNKSLEKNKNLNLAEYEKNLVKIFPKSEIITVSCVSSVSFHGYSLIQNGEKKRLKFVDSEMKQEFGKRFEEENEIYKNSYEEDGKLLWKDENDEDGILVNCEEDLLEDFTFKIAKRRLGVQIDLEEREYLFEKTEFKIFQINKFKDNEKTKSTNFQWKRYLLIALLMIIVKIIFKFIYK